MPDLPSGTVTLLFTDIEGSTRLLEELGSAYEAALAEHRRLIRTAVAAHSGVEVDTQGDAFFCVFSSAPAAARAAVEAQAALAATPVRVRIGLHTGEPSRTEEGYVGLDLHRGARVMAAGHGGQVLLTQATRRLLADELPLRDLGEHRLKDLPEPVWLYQLGEEEFPPLRSLNNSNLPVAPSPLVGRERELAELLALVRDDTRLLTLTGPGGTGKTRLVLEAAAELVGDFPNGVFLVQLAPLVDPELLASAIAQPLGVKERPGESLVATIAAHLEDKQLLLVLDNFEHLTEAAPLVGELLARAPKLQALATSREPLHLSGEREYAVPTLTEPEAVALFRKRSPRPLESNGTVAELCRRLDNLPLALELAAARTKLLPPEKLLERLELKLLTGGARDLPERQRTLVATIEWSYELLSAEEQALFRRLAVFAGGFTLEAAEEVAEADLDTLASLVDKSLVRAEGNRFSMLETIREFAGARLASCGEAEELRRRHAEHFVAFADEADRALRGPAESEWLASLKREHDNLRAALSWSLEGGEPALAVALAARLGYFWRGIGHFSDARRWLSAAIALGQVADERDRAWALFWNAVLAAEQDDHRHASESAAGALDLFQAVGDRSGAAQCHALQAWIAGLAQGDFARSLTLAEQAVEVARHSGDSWALALTLEMLASAAAELGNHDEAIRCHSESLALSKAVGDRRQVTITLLNLGWEELLRGDYEAADQGLMEGLGLARDRDDPALVAQAFCSLGFAAIGKGQATRAEELFGEGLRLAADVGVPRVIIECLEGLAGAAAAVGHCDRAARLWGASDAALAELGLPLLAPEQGVRDRYLTAAGRAAGDAAFEAGRAMTLDEAAVYAASTASH